MSLTKKSILVTGLSGLIGTKFKQLFQDTYELINLDLSSGVDITNIHQIKQIVNNSPAQTIIHLAAFTDVTKAFKQNQDKNGLCYQVNVIGTQNIAQVAYQYRKYLIHISTDYIFDGIKTEYYTETDKPNPIEWYGETKYLAEIEVIKSKAKHVILRLAFPYQAKPIRPDFLAKIINDLTHHTLAPSFVDHVITPTFTDDIVKVFDYCIKHQPTGIYHLVGSSSHSDYEIALMVKKIFNLTGDINPGLLVEYLKTQPRPYQQTVRISNQKLTRDFHLPMCSFKEGLTAILTQL